MKSKSKEGTLLIIIGLLLIAASLFLIGYNLYDEYRAGESAERVLTVLQENTPDSSTVESSAQARLEPDPMELPDYILNPDMEMPTAEIEGHYYIGILEVLPITGILRLPDTITVRTSGQSGTWKPGTRSYLQM